MKDIYISFRREKISHAGLFYVFKELTQFYLQSHHNSKCYVRMQKEVSETLETPRHSPEVCLVNLACPTNIRNIYTKMLFKKIFTFIPYLSISIWFQLVINSFDGIFSATEYWGLCCFLNWGRKKTNSRNYSTTYIQVQNRQKGLSPLSTHQSQTKQTVHDPFHVCSSHATLKLQWTNVKKHNLQFISEKPVTLKWGHGYHIYELADPK